MRIADNVLLYQHSNGGWGKNVEMARPLATARKRASRPSATRSKRRSTTGPRIREIRFLAQVYEKTGHKRFEEPIRRGIEYLIAAQYENGGWPQFYPIKKGYYEHITFNDGAMIGVMRILRDVAEGRAPFDYIDDQPLRGPLPAAIDKGLEVILSCQVGGRRPTDGLVCPARRGRPSNHGRRGRTN